MSPLEQLIMKKMQEGKKMSPMEQQAKMDNLDALKNEMHGMMKGHLEGPAKVEIAADSPEGLKAGLDKAKDVVGGDMPGAEDMDDGADDSDKPEDDMDMKDDDAHPPGDMIEEDIEHEDAAGELSSDEIDQLQMLLAKLKMKKV